MTEVVITHDMKLRVLERELALRKTFYPILVGKGKMKLDRMEYEIAVIESVIKDYQAVLKMEKDIAESIDRGNAGRSDPSDQHGPG